MAGTKTAFLVFPLAICLGALVVFWRNSVLLTEEEIPNLSVPSQALNFGTVWETESFSWTLPVQNTSIDLVDVTSISTSCSCLLIEPRSFTLAPGECRELQLKIDLASQSTPTEETVVQLRPRFKKEKTGSAEFIGPVWTVRGRIRQALKFKSSVYLGSHSELAQPLQSLSIPIEIHVPLATLTAKSDSPSFRVSAELPSASDKMVLWLIPTGSLPVGKFKGTITLTPVLKGGESLPDRHLQFAGIIVPDIEAVPPAVQVGGRTLGAMFEEVISLRSRTGHAFTDVRTEVDGEGLSVESVNGRQSFRIKQKASRAGLQNTRVHFFAEVAGRPVTVTVDVSYTGIDAS